MPDDLRMKRIAAFFKKELSRIVSRELKDPIFEGKLISFSNIRVSRDLSTAQVDVSVFGEGTVCSKIVDALTKAEPLIRYEIMAVSDLRRVPRFTFHEDRTMETGAKIDSILEMLDIPPEDTEDSK